MRLMRPTLPRRFALALAWANLSYFISPAECRAMPVSTSSTSSETDGPRSPAAWAGLVLSSTMAVESSSVSGYRVAPEVDCGEPGRTLAQALLLPVRAVASLVYAPAQGTLYLLDRYDLVNYVEGIFFDSTRTYGAFPVIFVETPFGISVGAQGIHRSLFGQKEELKVELKFGGRFQQSYRVSLDSGERFGPRFRIGVEGYFDRVPRELFYGVGNREELSSPVEVTSLVDPFQTDATAVQSSFSRDAALAAVRTSYFLDPTVRLQLSMAWWFSSFDVPRVGDDPSVDSIYDIGAFPFLSEGGVHTLSYEFRFTYDGRRSRDRYISLVTPSSGLRLDGILDVNNLLIADTPWYLRFSGDIQYNIDLFQGTRILVLRAYTEVVSGGVRDVPTYDLPRMGGPTLLRGYIRDRFRDQGVALASVEYSWLINNGIRAYLFLDGGRTFRLLDDLWSGPPHLGFGGGIEMFSYEALVARVQLGGSRSGDVIFSVILDDTFAVKSRHER